MRPKHWWYTVPLRLRSLFRGRAVERDLDDEVRFHLEQQIEQYVARGMAPGEARCAALSRFGGIEQRKEECRDMRHVRLLDELVRDIRHALRTFRKAPGFTAVVVLTLALGIGANTAVFSVVYGVLFAPLPYPEPDRLVVVYGTQAAPSNCPSCPASYPDYVDWGENSRVFDAIGASMPARVVMTGRGDAEEVPTAAVTESLSRVFRIAPQLGRWFTEEEDRPDGAKVAILTDRFWTRRFGRDFGVVGQTVVLNDTVRTIVGVMPAGFAHRGAEVFVPLAERLDEGQRHRHRFSVYGRLKRGIPLERARSEMIALGHRLARERHNTDGIDLRSYHSAVVRPSQWPSPPHATLADLLPLLQGAVTFVLLIACANIANLQLARTAARRHEIAVRSALGASRRRLARQFITEGLLLTLVGAAMGLGLAFGALSAFVTLAPSVLPRMTTLDIDLPVMLFTLVVAIATGVVFGLTPLLHVRQASPGAALRDEGNRVAGSRMSRRAGQTLLIAEIALSGVLLVGAGLTVKSLWSLQRQNLGLRIDRVLTFTASLPGSRYREEEHARDFFARTLARLRSVPGVQRIGAITDLPMGPTNQNGFIEVEGRTPWTPTDPPLVEQRFVSGDYYQVMGIPLIRGRFFTDADDARSTRVVVVNQRLATLCWPNEDPIGKRLRMGGTEWWEVVGVIADARILGPASAPPLEVAGPQRQIASTSLNFVIQSTTSDPTDLFNSVRKEIRALDPELPLRNMATMEAVVDDTLAEPKLVSTLLSAFAILAAVLALVGINGVMAYTVSQQRYEFGIRLALGASPGRLLRGVLARGSALAAIGVGLGVLGSMALTRFMTSMLYEVRPTDPVVMGAACAGILLAAISACVAPARRAARVNPIETLKAS